MKWLLAFLTLLLLIYIPQPVLSAEYTCDSCSGCSGNISSASSGDVVRLTTDIYADSTACINISYVNGVTFDCDSYTIDGGDSYTFGIDLDGSDYISIKNCRIQDFSYGIFVSSSHNVIDNVVSSGNSWAGINILNLQTNNTIRNSVFSSNTDGIRLTGNVTYNRFINVTCSSNEHGLIVRSSSNFNTFTDMTVKSNTEHGININESVSNTIKDSTIENNPIGIWVGDNANSNLIYNNYFDNTDNAQIDSGLNDWNITKTPGTNIIREDYLGGNFWSDYSGTDSDGDGLGDTAYSLGASNYDYLPLVHPPFVINLVPPTPGNGSVLSENWVFVNASANEVLDSCLLEWNGVNESISVSGRFCYKNKTGLGDGYYSFRVWGNDPLGNSSGTGERFITINATIPDTTPPDILYYVQPRLVVNGSNVSLMINASDPSGVDKTWLTIILPDSTPQTMNLENGVATNYTTSLIGRYNITFFANDTLGYEANASDYFDARESIAPVNLIVNVVNNTGGGIWCNLTIYETGTLNVAGEYQSGDGSFDEVLLDGVYDFLFEAYYGDLQVLLREVNISQNANRTFGLDRPYPAYGFTHTYVVQNDYIMSSARVRVAYTESLFSNESYLGVYVCEDWDFENRGCDGDWSKTIGIQNKTQDYFDVEVSGFSAFSIKQEAYCGDGDCSGDEDSGSCPEDCECDLGDTRPCNVTHQGECGKGDEMCVDGQWTGCPEPENEICDGEDNDCDGVIDNVNGGESVEETQCRCYDGGTPQDEVCNGIDDDCDYDIDEDGDCCVNDETRSCGPSNETGTCKKGTSTCSNNIWGSCEGAVYATDEICGNELDDDCDGETDEDCWDWMGLVLILVGIIILVVVAVLYLHLRSKGEELTWEELRKKWTPAYQ